jgi:hypothetical protein
MSYPNLSNGSQPSERTPLLPPQSNGATSSSENEAPVSDEEIHTIADAVQGPLEPPLFQGRGKRRSYSHSHWLAPDEDSNAIPDQESPPQFQENGLLVGLSRTKFRLVYGGILLGYFVSAHTFSGYIAQCGKGIATSVWMSDLDSDNNV